MQHALNQINEQKSDAQIYLLKPENLLQYIEIKSLYANRPYQLLVDSGAQLNIIKKSEIPEQMMDTNQRIFITGITNNPIQTLGTVCLYINNLPFEFHVAPESFSIRYDGILGIKILKEQKLRLDEGYLEINNIKLQLITGKSDTSCNEAISTADTIAKLIDLNSSNTEDNSEITLHNDTITLFEEINLLDTDITDCNTPILELSSDSRSIEDEYTLESYAAFTSILQETTGLPQTEKETRNSEIIEYISFDVENLDEHIIEYRITDEIGDGKILHAGSINLIQENISNPKCSDPIERKSQILEKLDLDHLSTETKDLIQKLVLQNKDICWIEGDEIGTCNIEEHEINLIDEKPVYVKQFPLPYKLKETVTIETQKLIDKNLVRPSKSAFNAPAWLVGKKPGKDGKKK